MSYELMRAMIERSQSKGLVRTVAIAVASYPPVGTNVAFPSNETLVGQWGFSERTVQRSLRQLELLGELRRQPQLESPQRPRVYLIDPGFRRQLSILDGGRQTELDARLAPALAPATSRAPANGREEGRTTPPTPQGGLPQATELQSGQTPRAIAVERETQARRRRRRRRPDGQGSVASEPCPLQAKADSEACDPELERCWNTIEARLRERLGEEAATIWFGDGHLHEASERLVLGVYPHTVGWVAKRFGAVLADVSDRPVEVVGCHALAEDRR